MLPTFRTCIWLKFNKIVINMPIPEKNLQFRHMFSRIGPNVIERKASWNQANHGNL